MRVHISIFYILILAILLSCSISESTYPTEIEPESTQVNDSLTKANGISGDATISTPTSVAMHIIGTDFNPSDSSKDDISEDEASESSAKSSKSSQRREEDLQNWRELYQIAYTTFCMDARLGVETVRKFQTGERGPTSTELETIQSCEIERADLLPDDDPRKESADGEKDQDKDEDEDAVSRPKWNPSPDRIACYFSTIGKSSYRAIRAGERLPTTGEIDASRQCVDGTRTLNHVPHSLASHHRFITESRINIHPINSGRTDERMQGDSAIVVFKEHYLAVILGEDSGLI